MKKRLTVVVLTAAMLLSGCSEGGGALKGSSVTSTTPSAATSTAGSTTPNAANTESSAESRSGAPTVIAPNFLGSSSAAATAPEEPTVSMVTPTGEELTSVKLIGTDESYVVSSGNDFYIENGEALEIEGTLTVESGAKLVVADGSMLFNKGDIRLDGELVLSEHGKLIMEHDTARIEGSGQIVVEKNFEQIEYANGTISTHIVPPARVVENGVTTVGGVVIANKAIKLPPEFGSHLSLDEVEPEVYYALAEMNEASAHQYVNMSGYRSYWDQKAIFQNYCYMYGYEEANTFSSQEGHSEHQTGLTMDLDDFEESYGDTPEGIWLAENCYKYGFIIRYPKGKEHITGYTYEPWHVRYLGKSTAKLVYDSGLTLEEFLDVEGGTIVID